MARLRQRRNRDRHEADWELNASEEFVRLKFDMGKIRGFRNVDMCIKEEYAKNCKNNMPLVIGL